MAAKIIIDAERCKGCYLCVDACPKNCIYIREQSNKKGYFPVGSDNVNCTGCSMCAIICPEAAIEVYKDSNIIEMPAGKKKERTGLVRKET